MSSHSQITSVSCPSHASHTLCCVCVCHFRCPWIPRSVTVDWHPIHICLSRRHLSAVILFYDSLEVCHCNNGAASVYKKRNTLYTTFDHWHFTFVLSSHTFHRVNTACGPAYLSVPADFTARPSLFSDFESRGLLSLGCMILYGFLCFPAFKFIERASFPPSCTALR